MGDVLTPPAGARLNEPVAEDRKSTRLNSSHSQISYAVFCLKKKKKQQQHRQQQPSQTRIHISRSFSTSLIQAALHRPPTATSHPHQSSRDLQRPVTRHAQTT